MDIKTSIRRKSLAEEVAELIKKQISEGKLAKGDKLPAEPELMRLFGVGRSTVREAIKMLVNMGYLSVQQGRGTFVENVTETNELFHQRLKRYVYERGESAKCGDIEKCIAADICFHKAVARATHNEILSELYDGMTIHLASGYEYIYEDTLHLMASQSLHERLVQYIEDGNIEEAVRSAKLLWNNVMEKDTDE